MKPEELLHLFTPYLPTDRFRALLRGVDLPTTSEGAALQVDLVGFTPMTTQLVAEQGAQRACEELKRRLNPMFEAVAGQVFHHGGSVITFTGDGFVAWFDDLPSIGGVSVPVPGLFRALAAGLEMQAVMPLFRGLQLKVCIGTGVAYRWVVGQPEYGLADVLLGPAVDAMNTLASESQPGQVLVHRDALPALRHENVRLELADSDHVIALALPAPLAAAARRYRWPAWAVEDNIYDVLMATRWFIGAAIRERVENGLGDFVAELRDAIPMFIRVGGIEPHRAEAHGRLNSYVCAMQDVLNDFGGRCVAVEVTEKGTLVFGVFGAPITHGNDAERAIRAALALRDIDTARANGITQRFGVSRGLLYAGTIGGETRREYSTIGDVTNIASRLMSAANDGQILVSTDVRAEVGPDILFQDLSPIAIKGKKDLIPVAEPVGIQTTRGVLQSTEAGAFIGRTDELAVLDDLLARTITGTPQIVSIEGPAGVGKTRLAAEFARRSMAQQESLLVANGAAANIGRSIPYAPWRSIIASLLELKNETSPQEVIEQLPLLIECANAEWLPRLPLLGELLQVPIPETPLTAALDGQHRRQALVALVTDLILSIARQQPMVIILDDIQWIDELSAALAVELARRLSVDPAPVLVLLIYRPIADSEPLSKFVHAIRDLTLHTRLALDELGRADVLTLMENYLRVKAPPELAEFIYERARGNPFFVLEVLGALIETGHIHVVEDTVQIAANLKNTNLPRTVQGLVQARVDRLSDADRLVLKVAAVIGRQFQVRILAESIPVPMSYEELLTHLQSLEERDLSHREAVEPELSYVFTHAITQEVAYQSLLLAQRQQLHYAVANALEALAPDAVEQLAYHFGRGGSAERALHYLVLAGQRAFREYANQAALDYFTQALELSVNELQEFEIRRQRVHVMSRLGDMAGIQADLPEMAAIANLHGPAWQAAVHLLTADYEAQISAWPRVIDQVQKAAALARQLDDKVLAWDSYRLLHRAFLALSQPEEAEWVIESMQPLATYLDDPRRAIELTLLKAETGPDTPPHEVIPEVQTALAQAQEHADGTLAASCWATLIRLFLRANDLPAALDAARHLIVLLRRIGDRPGEGLTLNQIGTILASLGQFSQGTDHLQDAYKILHQIGERSGEAMSLVYLGLIAFHRRAYGEAIAYMQRGLAIQRDLNVESDTALTLFYLGNAYIGQTDYPEASRCLGEASAFFWANHQPQHTDEVFAALAEIDIQCSNLSSARAHIDPLLERLRQPKRFQLILPGLAYWRAIHVLEQAREPEQATALRGIFRKEAEALLARLVDSDWRDAYVQNIWYHSALLTA